MPASPSPVRSQASGGPRKRSRSGSFNSPPRSPSPSVSHSPSRSHSPSPSPARPRPQASRPSPQPKEEAITNEEIGITLSAGHPPSYSAALDEGRRNRIASGRHQSGHGRHHHGGGQQAGRNQALPPYTPMVPVRMNMVPVPNDERNMLIRLHGSGCTECVARGIAPSVDGLDEREYIQKMKELMSMQLHHLQDHPEHFIPPQEVLFLLELLLTHHWALHPTRGPSLTNMHLAIMRMRAHPIEVLAFAVNTAILETPMTEHTTNICVWRSFGAVLAKMEATRYRNEKTWVHTQLMAHLNVGNPINLRPIWDNIIDRASLREYWPQRPILVRRCDELEELVPKHEREMQTLLEKVRKIEEEGPAGKENNLRAEVEEMEKGVVMRELRLLRSENTELRKLLVDRRYTGYTSQFDGGRHHAGHDMRR